MQALIDAAVRMRKMHRSGHRNTVSEVRHYLDSVFNALKGTENNNQLNKPFEGIRARVMKEAVDLMSTTYRQYLVSLDILNSQFFIFIRNIIAHSLNEQRFEHIPQDEKALLKPVCEIVIYVALNMKVEQANSEMLHFFFSKMFVQSMIEGLKRFSTEKTFYDADQKAIIITIVLKLFSNYFVAKGDDAASGNDLLSLVHAALECTSSPIYEASFQRVLQPMRRNERLSAQTELFLVNCPTYIKSFKAIRQEVSLVDALTSMLKPASNIFPKLIPELPKAQPSIKEYARLLIDLLLLVRVECFYTQPDLVGHLITIVKMTDNNQHLDAPTTHLIEESISLIYKLAINTEIRQILRQTLAKIGDTNFFQNLSKVSSNEHIKFMSTLISLMLSSEDMAEGEYSPEMVKTFVSYLKFCGDDPLQQCHGVQLDSMVTTLSGIVENANTQKELIKQEAIPVMAKCAKEPEFDISTVKEPSLDSLWAMSFLPEAVHELLRLPEFHDYLQTLMSPCSTETASKTLPKQLEKVADGLLWNMKNKKATLSKETIVTEFAFDIMISYQHSDSVICNKIYDRLSTQHGYRVWLDRKHLHGKMLEVIANAIENTEIILIIVSQGYQKSKFCRSEAEYAYEKKRCIIPLKVHKDFEAGGWLAMIITNLCRVNFSSADNFEKAFKDLIREIDLNRKPKQTATIFAMRNVDPPVQPNIIDETPPGTESVSRITPTTTELNSYGHKPMENWTSGDVRNFLDNNNLQKFSKILPTADGKGLLTLYKMGQESENKLFEHCKAENKKITMDEYLRFSTAINDIVQSTSILQN